jgi:hypothetical protein
MAINNDIACLQLLLDLLHSSHVPLLLADLGTGRLELCAHTGQLLAQAACLRLGCLYIRCQTYQLLLLGLAAASTNHAAQLSEAVQLAMGQPNTLALEGLCCQHLLCVQQAFTHIADAVSAVCTRHHGDLTLWQAAAALADHDMNNHSSSIMPIDDLLLDAPPPAYLDLQEALLPCILQLLLHLFQLSSQLCHLI